MVSCSSRLVNLHHYLYLYISAATGATFLNFADSEIGRVIPSGTDDYNFRYGPQESDDTVWNGNDCVIKIMCRRFFLWSLFEVHVPQIIMIEYDMGRGGGGGVHQFGAGGPLD